MSYEKNVDVVLQAMKIVSEYKKVKFMIVGGGPDLKRLKDYSKKINLNVKFIGNVDNEKLVDYYNKADIFVTASTIETEGIVLLEAMACGLPIVGVDKLAIPEVVRDGENGFIAKVNDPEDIQKLISENKRDVKDAVGDMYWFLASLANVCDVDMDEAIEMTIKDNKKRYPVKKTKGHHTNIRLGGYDGKYKSK